MFWQPRSILQLVLLGFMLVATPLTIAVALTVQALITQAEDNATLQQRTVNLTRDTQQLQGDLLDLERRTRQYATLQDSELLRLVMGGIDDLYLVLEQIRDRLRAPFDQPVLQLVSQLHMLRQQLSLTGSTPERLVDALGLFEPITRSAQAVDQLSRAQVDADLQAQLDQAVERRDELLIAGLLLAGLTALVGLFFSYWIIRPVRQLEKAIRQLGKGQAQKEIRIQGPREIRSLGAQLGWLRDHLLELDEQKAQFLRHMSHELKTPLASLREGTDLLMEGVVGPELTPPQQEVLSIIGQNARELQRLIENLLDYNQLVRQSSLEISLVNLPELIEDVIESHRLALQRHDLSVESQVRVDYWSMDGEKTRVALDNLLSNAVCYAAEGSVVSINIEREADGLRIDVANSGPAIGEDEAERIFEPFYQGSSRRQGALKGSGIGLSVARECVQVQGGWLQLVRRKGYDVCFSIQIPSKEAA